MEEALRVILGSEQVAALDATILDYIVQVLQVGMFVLSPLFDVPFSVLKQSSPSDKPS
jgi:hypothetical protein